jgi:hypothetical protein
MEKEKLIKQIKKQFEVLQNASQVPLIALNSLEKGENWKKFQNAYMALDRAQISLSNNQFLRAISLLNESKYNLQETLIGPSIMHLLDDKIKSLKKEIKVEEKPEEFEIIEAQKSSEDDDIRARITARRVERRKKIQKILNEKR